MKTKHVPILKANQGELKALRNLTLQIKQKVRPLFEIGRITDSIRERKWFKNSATPNIAYIDRVIGGISRSWTDAAMVDGYHWLPTARVETGEHAIAYMVAALRAEGIPVIPVVGYDRWENQEYRIAMQSIPAPSDGHWCLRIDSAGIEDAAEPDILAARIQEIVDGLELNPAQCSVLIDFADISLGRTSIEALILQSSTIIETLEDFGFDHYIVAGCSLPQTINLAIGTPDTAGTVLRKEMLVWQTLRHEMPNSRIVSGDYGVRGPTTVEIRSKHTNGKIRHTIKTQIFVVRGHSFAKDGNYSRCMAYRAQSLRLRTFWARDSVGEPVK